MNLVDRLQPLFERLPEEARQRREALWQRLRDEGFPDRRHERWRYTDLAAALPEQLPAAGSAALTLPRLDGLRRVAFINGRGEGFDDTERNVPDDAAGRRVEDPSDLLNAALASSGIALQAAAGEHARPVHLCSRVTSGSVHLRHRLHLGRDARMLLYWDDALQADAAFVSQTLDIHLQPGAALTLVRCHRNAATGPALLRTQAVLEAGARLHYTSLDSGSGLSRHNLHIRLGEAAAAHLQGVYAPHASGQIDTFATIEHAAPESTSRMRLRGLGMDRGIGVLTGRVHVHAGAQKTDSDQQLASLLLSQRAQINAKPELEIYADDVACAHGNAIGQIDRDALHYLQTRGVPHATARALLIGGFAAEVLTVDDAPAVSDALLAAVDEALAHAEWSSP